ncbi:uncharacterized protein [Ptychodera flava]|uniref:uncharacterized protein n=1 Tax=Ptychodera flava TaxID=63121 RepID=UPI00396A6295
MISNPQMRCVKSYLILSYQRRVHQLQKAHQQMRQSIASLQRHCITETAGCIRQHEKLQFQEMHRRRQTGGTRAESNPGEDLHGQEADVCAISGCKYPGSKRLQTLHGVYELKDDIVLNMNNKDHIKTCNRHFNNEKNRGHPHGHTKYQTKNNLPK